MTDKEIYEKFIEWLRTFFLPLPDAGELPVLEPREVIIHPPMNLEEFIQLAATDVMTALAKQKEVET